MSASIVRDPSFHACGQNYVNCKGQLPPTPNDIEKKKLPGAIWMQQLLFDLSCCALPHR